MFKLGAHFHFGSWFQILLPSQVAYCFYVCHFNNANTSFSFSKAVAHLPYYQFSNLMLAAYHGNDII